MSGLQKIDEKQIKEAVAARYHVYPAEDVCLYHDYEFIRRGDDKVRHDFIYGIIDERCKKPFTNDEELAEFINDRFYDLQDNPSACDVCDRESVQIGVYIPGVKMPKTDVYEISIDNTNERDKTVMTVYKRKDDGFIHVFGSYELVPVQPPVRLIDTDALLVWLKQEVDDEKT